MKSSRLSEDEEIFVAAKNAALRFLTYRARSEAEVRLRLVKKYSLETIDQVIEALREQKLLDDAAFAQQWRSNREQHRPRAQRLVQQELRQKGVSSEVIQDSLDGFDDEANAHQAGARIAKRQSIRNGTEEEFRRRISSHLQSRGFSYGLVRSTVEQLWQELRADSLDRDGNPDDDEEQSPEPNTKAQGETQCAE